MGSSPRLWRRLPLAPGLHWFARGLECRDVAEPVDVRAAGYVNGFAIFAAGRHRKLIEPHDGWWLPIADERATAPVEVSA